MQTQPKPVTPQRRRTERARQAIHSTDDTFAGGAPLRPLPITAPWRIGTGRLFDARPPGR